MQALQPSYIALRWGFDNGWVELRHYPSGYLTCYCESSDGKHYSRNVGSSYKSITYALHLCLDVGLTEDEMADLTEAVVNAATSFLGGPDKEAKA